jgi:hypothetical protein
MFVELQAAVEDAGGRIVSPDTLNEVETVRELLTAIQRIDKRKRSKNLRLKKKRKTKFSCLRFCEPSAIQSSVSLRKRFTKTF